MLICNVKDPVTGEAVHPRSAPHRQKAENYLKSTGIADTATSVRRRSSSSSTTSASARATTTATTTSTAKEGFWNSGKDEKPNLGYKPRYKEGYFPVPPMDQLQDIRTEMMLTLEQVGVPVEVHHHEVATAGQGEIDMRFDTLTKMADNLLKYKYIIKQVARRHGKTATFMPKPIFQDNGSGMHVHQSLWKGETNLFFERRRLRRTSARRRCITSAAF